MLVAPEAHPAPRSSAIARSVRRPRRVSSWLAAPRNYGSSSSWSPSQGSRWRAEKRRRLKTRLRITSGQLRWWFLRAGRTCGLPEAKSTDRDRRHAHIWTVRWSLGAGRPGETLGQPCSMKRDHPHCSDRVLRLLLDPRDGAALARRSVRLPAPPWNEVLALMGSAPPPMSPSSGTGVVTFLMGRASVQYRLCFRWTEVPDGLCAIAVAVVATGSWTIYH
jgi:hypothetical protein